MKISGERGDRGEMMTLRKRMVKEGSKRPRILVKNQGGINGGRRQRFKGARMWGVEVRG